MLFLFTSEVNDTKFTDTLVETNHITTVRLIKREEDLFILAVEDVNNNGFCAAFKTEESLRNGTKELLAAMNSNASIADTMKVRDISNSKGKDEVVDRLFDLLKTLKS